MSSVENSKHWLDQAEDHAEQALRKAERTSPERNSPERNSPGRAGRVRRGRASAGLTRSRLLGIGLILISALLLLSCGDAGDEVAGIKKTTSTTTSVPADNTSGSAASVKVANTNLGDVLVTSKGMTLYMFQPDGTDGSTCVDACAQTWPPLTTVGQPTGT
ncbi:MAG TPA: hypothetical protein VL068_02455, partial [Microthrixaceae bacterium]|nr:hypothetical protein [Microthrixaceae bacterium]